VEALNLTLKSKPYAKRTLNLDSASVFLFGLRRRLRSWQGDDRSWRGMLPAFERERHFRPAFQANFRNEKDGNPVGLPKNQAYRIPLQCQQQATRRLKVTDDFVEESCGCPAIDQAMIVGQAKRHHQSDLDFVTHHDWQFARSSD
jgi:hypothetical protein